MNWLPDTPAAWIGAGAMATYAGLLAQKARAATLYVREERESFQNKKPSGDLTILQPIVSGDGALERCLRASAELARHGTQLVWLLDEGDEEAHRIARDLDRPGVTIQIVQAAPPGINPKVDKLRRGFENVHTEYVAVLDDDTTVGTRHLDRALQVLASDAGRGGLYTGLPTYRAEPASVGGSLVAAFVNSSSVLTYLPPAHAGPPITLNGMFYVTRADDLRALGGWSAIADQLCDDLALARLYRGANRPIHQGAMAQVLYTGPMDLRGYFRRMHRWFFFALVLLRGLNRSQRVQLAWSLGAPPLLLWLSLAGALASRPLTVAFALLIMARHWALSALLVATREVEETSEDRTSHGAEVFPISSIFTELLQPLHAIHAYLVPTIRWRAHRMRVRRDGSFETLPK